MGHPARYWEREQGARSGRPAFFGMQGQPCLKKTLAALSLHRIRHQTLGFWLCSPPEVRLRRNYPIKAKKSLSIREVKEVREVCDDMPPCFLIILI